MNKIPSILVLLLALCSVVPGRSNDSQSVASNSEVEFDSTAFYGDLVATSGDRRLYVETCFDDSADGDDVFDSDRFRLIRFVGGEPHDTANIIGAYTRFAEAPLGHSYLLVGVDTIDVDFNKPLPKVLDLRLYGSLSGCRKSYFREQYALNDSALQTGFQINVAMPDEASLHIQDLISEMIRNDLSLIFADYDENDNAILPEIAVLNMDGKSVDQMSRYYFDRFCELYHDKYALSDDEKISDGEGGVFAAGEPIPETGVCYIYQMDAHPVWQNDEQTLTSWRFYSYTYTGGVHGGCEEFYLTIDNATGRILGVDDFFTESEFKESVKDLGKMVDSYEYGFGDGAALDSAYGEIRFENDKLLKEQIDGKVYPRPALTKHGVVFSYQPYWKASFSEGVLHFVLPYNVYNRKK